MNFSKNNFKYCLQHWLEINHIESNVPNSTIFPHRTGIVIGGSVRMGEKCRISQGVTIGSKSRFDKNQPVLGNNVVVYCGAVIIGKISIGDNAIIGAGSIVLKDVPRNKLVVGVWK
jgi:serine O-acetyltransferase